MMSENEAYASAWQLPALATDYVHHQNRTIGLVPKKPVLVNGDSKHPMSEPACLQERPVLFSNINNNPRWAHEEAPWIECEPIAWRFA